MSNNNDKLALIADALGDLCGRVVFVGGCVAQLYAESEAAEEVRPTDDVDCVVDLSSYSDYNRFAEQLRLRNFSNSCQPGDPLCRWSFENEIVDIMPYEDSPIGPSNRWYKPGFKNKIIYEISKGLTIQMLPITYYVATKFEALKSRGGDDYRFSHDFEDIVFVLRNSATFQQQYSCIEDQSLKSYLKDRFKELTERPYLHEEVESALPFGETDKADYVIEIMKSVCG